MKLKILTLNFVVALMLGALFYGFFYYISNEKRDQLIELTMQNARLSARGIMPALEDALARPGDKAAMQNVLNSLLRIDSVTSSFVLDSNGKVVAHFSEGEVGTVMSGTIYELALSPQNLTLEQYYDKDHILYSQHITSRLVLFLMVSAQRDAGLARLWQTKYAAILGLAWLLFVFITFVLSRKLFDEVEIPAERKESPLDNAPTEEHHL